METLASLFVGKPLNILVVAVVFLAAWFVRHRSGSGSRRPHSLLVVAVAWAVYAAWEWLVVTRTPEANIRVDLMVIWPALLIVSFVFTIRAFRPSCPEREEKP